MTGERTALLLGATGLVGGHCLDLLLADEAYGRVVTIGRRVVEREDRKLEQHVVDFERMADYADLMRARDVFCCLGTTIKKAGSQAAFRRIDYTYVYESARVACMNGAHQFLLVSSLGASADSSVFYSRTKGEVERDVSELPFHGVQIFRPSLLLGEREEVRLKEQVAEKVSKAISFLLIGPLRKYKPVHARDVAKAMVRVAKQEPSGVNVFESVRIAELASG